MADVFSKDALGLNLIEAAKNGNVDECQKLLAAGADVNFQDKDQNTALFWGGRNHLGCVEFLLQNGANPNILNNVGCGPLHACACYNGNVQILQLLLDAGADPTVQGGNPNKISPARFAANRQFLEAATLLRAAEDDRKTPLQISIPAGVAGYPLTKVFNFVSYERISLVKEGGAVKAMTIQPFDQVQNDPDLEVAYLRSRRNGGNPDEGKVFTRRLFKLQK